jgi:acetolactate decarboxylase
MGVRCLFALVLAAWLVPIAPAMAQERDAIAQYSTLGALAAGFYDGTMTVGEMAPYGDLGLGTYDALDGEMIVIDGTYWRAAHDGTVEVVGPDTETPFVAVTFFDADLVLPVASGLDMAALGALLDSHVANANLPVAVRIEGRFERLTYRAPARQNEPYPTLIEALKNQAVWTVEDIDATLVGFWYPAWLANINVAGWHLHFVSADGTRGGHILDLMTGAAEVALDPSAEVTVLLPLTEGFATLDLAKP